MVLMIASILQVVVFLFLLFTFHYSFKCCTATLGYRYTHSFAYVVLSPVYDNHFVLAGTPKQLVSASLAYAL
jgi:hypothetical protein